MDETEPIAYVSLLHKLDIDIWTPYAWVCARANLINE